MRDPGGVADGAQRDGVLATEIKQRGRGKNQSPVCCYRS